MPRIPGLSLALVFLLALPAAAQNADLSVVLTPNVSLRPGKTSRINARVNNRAASRAEGVRLFVTFPEPLEVVQRYPFCARVDATSYRCALNPLAPNGAVSIDFDVMPTRSGPPVTITASVESDQPESTPDDNRASLVAPIYDVADLDVKIVAPAKLDASNRAVAEFSFTNPGDTPATNVSAEIITQFATPEPVPGCKPETTYRLLCTIDAIAPHATAVLRIPAQFATPYLRSGFATNVTQKPTEDFRVPLQSVFVNAVFYKPFTVTSDADGGTGSLRQAIVDANAACSADDANPPCSIEFAPGSYAIAPRSPLPQITVTDFGIDGESRVVLSGRDAGDAEGLDLFTRAAVVRGMTIHGFARNGILSRTRPLIFLPQGQVIDHNDLSGNGLRGVMAFALRGEITNNVFRDNVRSGVFLTDLSFATIRDNQLIGNGASGIFIGPGSGSVIEHNEIAGHPQFGIALTSSSGTDVLENSIHDNVEPGIDIGLDGPSLNGTPRITNAFFDAASGETVIEGETTFSPSRLFLQTLTAFVYANNRDAADGEVFLGSVRADDDGRFVVRHRGDLRGMFIDAMTLAVTDFGDGVSRQSTEFGARRRVE